MHLNSELLFRKYVLPRFKDYYKVLEVGPAGIPTVYEKIVNNSLIEWHTVDFGNSTFIDSSVENLTYKLETPYSFPIEDEIYDIVLSGQVIEHVQKPWTWLKELKRVTKPKGYIITINPVSWPYHEAPVDCWRIFPSGMEALAEETGLSVELCLFESLEKEQILLKDPSADFIPGRSYNYSSYPNLLSFVMNWNKLVRKLPGLRKRLSIPIEVSYDCVSIFQKT